ncbi:hypothetical protein GCM10010358_34910 [Streptomyces minutiscleroticus]|uniref:Uncharacterized protein n=1 Tax=Streptomyces minutiscleroticus TaxID=68238 RepID=A0A918NJ31_9ACTN|nr:hypothetical protein GCM10010358_34910 [Streptomyces minutiscleroticus]
MLRLTPARGGRRPLRPAGRERSEEDQGREASERSRDRVVSGTRPPFGDRARGGSACTPPRFAGRHYAPGPAAEPPRIHRASCPAHQGGEGPVGRSPART